MGLTHTSLLILPLLFSLYVRVFVSVCVSVCVCVCVSVWWNHVDDKIQTISNSDQWNNIGSFTAMFLDANLFLRGKRMKQTLCLLALHNLVPINQTLFVKCFSCCSTNCLTRETTKQEYSKIAWITEIHWRQLHWEEDNLSRHSHTALAEDLFQGSLESLEYMTTSWL